jgi:ABC-type sugar transport systems, permease components
MKKINLARREARNGWLYASLPLAGFLIFFFAPFAISVVRSFQRGITQEFVGFYNYVSIIQSAAFRIAAGNTIRFTLFAVPLNILIGLVIALSIRKMGASASFFRTVFLIPYVIPVASTVMVFQILFERSGVVNTILRTFNFELVDFLHSENTFFVLLFLYIWKNFGYSVVIFLTGLVAIPRDYGEAARVDGAGAMRTFRHITMPLLSSTFFFVFIISIVNSFKVFREAYALGGAYPHDSIYMLQHFMNNNLQNLNYQRLSVAAMYMFIVILLLVLFLYLRNCRREDHQL